MPPGPALDAPLEAAADRDPVASVLVCTRDRADGVVRTVRSILADAAGRAEVLVMDQSAGAETASALAPLLSSEPTVRLVRLRTRGKALALNAAWPLARGRCLALTDDDCQVRPGWLSGLLGALAPDDIACACGPVVAPAWDPGQGYIATNEVPAPLTLRHTSDLMQVRPLTSRTPVLRGFGIGANLAVRREVVERLGGWDPCIGPGAPFPSGDDYDLMVRALLAGYGVQLTPDPVVDHHGVRPWSRVREDQMRVGTGLGAAFAKYLRCGHLYRAPLRMLAFRLSMAASDAARLRRPRLAFTWGWLRGCARGMVFPLDRPGLRFRSPGDAPW